MHRPRKESESEAIGFIQWNDFPFNFQTQSTHKDTMYRSMLVFSLLWICETVCVCGFKQVNGLYSHSASSNVNRNFLLS